MEGEGAMEADTARKDARLSGPRCVTAARRANMPARSRREFSMPRDGVFLEHGFQGASVDEIAEAASAGKPTIYARFPNKQALFTAVVERLVRQNTSLYALSCAGRLDRGATRRSRRHNPDPDSGPGDHWIDQGRRRRSAALSRSRDERQLHGPPTPDRSRGDRVWRTGRDRRDRRFACVRARQTLRRRRAGFSTSWSCRC